METIAIIGGGFCGTMAAVNLARLASRPIRIVLINCARPVARGVAYGTSRPEHLLNVAARNMSAVPDHADHFVDWLRTRVDYSDIPDPQLREMFVPRRVYGDYLRSLLFNYLSPIDRHCPAQIELIEDEAIDIEPSPDGPVTVLLKSGEPIVANRVLLATGNQNPTPFLTNGKPLSHPAYFADPWQDWHSHLPVENANIIVLGTGLTMVDVFLTLTNLNWRGKLIAVSRNGKLPQSHFRGIDYPDFLPAEPEKLGLKKLVKLLEHHCAQLRRLGANPGIVVDRLRPHTQRIWQNFTAQEKREFLTKYATRWNVVRHRVAQPVHQLLTEAITDGNVQIVRGSIEQIAPDAGRLRVTIHENSGKTSHLEGALVINCTGPCAGLSETDIPLFKNLLKRGLIHTDELDMGIDVAPNFAVQDVSGNKSDVMFGIGPLMKGSLWETTAVPELRGQALRAAEILVDAAGVSAEQDYRMSVEQEHVLEYCI